MSDELFKGLLILIFIVAPFLVVGSLILGEEKPQAGNNHDKEI